MEKDTDQSSQYAEVAAKAWEAMQKSSIHGGGKKFDRESLYDRFEDDIEERKAAINAQLNTIHENMSGEILNDDELFGDG